MQQPLGRAEIELDHFLPRPVPDVGHLGADLNYYLTDAESAMVDQVCAAFDRVAVVLNVGGVMDVSWFYENDPAIKPGMSPAA